MYQVKFRDATNKNQDFRQVLYTTPLSQVVAMSLLPGEDIGIEVHHGHDQIFMVMQGQGRAVVADQATDLVAGSMLVVPAGTTHNIVNGDGSELKLLTIYAPPTHPDGTVHHTKAEAQVAEEAEQGQAGGEASAMHYDNEEVVEVVGY